MAAPSGGKEDSQIYPESGKDAASDSSVPEKSKDIDRIGMPNVSQGVQKEIERLTKEAIKDLKTIVLADVDYESIDFIPEEEIDIPTEVDFIKDSFNNAVNVIRQQLAPGDVQAGEETDEYLNYFNLFEVSYNGSTGRPEIVLNLEFTGLGAEDLMINKVAINRNDVHCGD